MREIDTSCQILGCPKMGRDENELYSMGDEANNESKENLAKKGLCYYLCIGCFK